MRYRPHLDALRAAAALAVVARHLWPIPPQSSELFRLREWGALGVPVFFVLSGYLITGILLDARREAEEREVSRGGVWIRFWLRRALRIFPLYYAALAASWLLGGGSLPGWAWHVAYLSNVRMALDNAWAGPFSPLWSLAVEEQFYVIWPILILALPYRRLPALMIGCLFISPIWRIAIQHAYGEDHLAAVVLLPACLDQLGAGALLAWLERGDRAWRRPLRRLGAGATIFVLLTLLIDPAPHRSIFLSSPIFLTVFSLASAAWIAAAARGLRGVAGRVAEQAPVLFLGKISYGIYLLHYTLSYEILRMTTDFSTSSWEFFLAGTALTIVAATVSWYGFERPLLRLKERLPYLPRPSPPSAPSSRAASPG